MTVLVAMSSVAFMTFAISRWATIPDWVAEARELEDFRLTRTEGETPSWSAVTRLREEPVGTSANIADVLEKMYQRATQTAQDEFNSYNNEIPERQQEIEATRTSIAEDTIGVQNRVEEANVLLGHLETEVNRLTAEAEEQKTLAHQLQQERERRRSDVFRLQEELAEVQADTFRAEQLEKELTDMIRRLQGAVVKLQTRQDQLQNN